jgi:hypothetical protein
LRILAIIFVLFSAIAAHAQTAEETVAYIVAGAEDIPWQKIGDAPLTYKFHTEKGDLIVSVASVSDCAFNITVDFAVVGAKKPDGVKYQIDLSRAVDIQLGHKDSPFEGFVTYQISDALVDCKGQALCERSVQDNRLFLSSASQPRAQKAIDYLRAKYCKGSDF